MPGRFSFSPFLFPVYFSSADHGRFLRNIPLLLLPLLLHPTVIVTVRVQITALIRYGALVWIVTNKSHPDADLPAVRIKSNTALIVVLPIAEAAVRTISPVLQGFVPMALTVVRTETAVSRAMTPDAAGAIGS